MFLDADPWRHLAAEPPLRLFDGFRGVRRIVHAARFAWLDRGAALQAFQAGDLFPLFADRLLQRSDFAGQLNQQSLQLWTVQTGEVGWRRHIRKESHRVEPGQEKNAGPPTVLPLLRGRPLSWRFRWVKRRELARS